MAIRMIEIEPVNKPPAVDKKLGRPKVHPDRAIYQREWMRRFRVELKADAVRLAQVE
jgi:hypothetical protein